jgi:hypothetical protein
MFFKKGACFKRVKEACFLLFSSKIKNNPFGLLSERVTGIEPVSRPWQGRIIATIRYPLNLLNKRINKLSLLLKLTSYVYFNIKLILSLLQTLNSFQNSAYSN